MRVNYFLACIMTLFVTLSAFGQYDSTNVHDSLTVVGDAQVGGYLITKHIKSPDGTIHLGDSSMTFTTYTLTNPIKSASYVMEGQSTSVGNSSIGIGWGTNAAAASKAFALGTNTKAYGDNSMAFGNLAEVDADWGNAFGYNTKVGSSATYAIALGSGLALTPMTNNTSQSLAVGFNSTVPTFFVTGGNGTAGSLGNVGVGTTTLNARLSVNGDAIFAGTTGTPTVSAYIKGNSNNSTASGPDYTWYSDLTTGVFHPAASVIAFSKAGSEIMRVHSNGNVGIGNTSPTSRLTVYGATDEGGLIVKTTQTTDYQYNTFIDVNRANCKALAIVNEGTGGGYPTEAFLVWGDGRTKIGVSGINAGAHTDAMLMVAGKTVSKSFYVTTQNWSDFVFDRNYKLMELKELEAYYKQNHHLPNVPTEKEIKENGNNLGETDAILLQKIEELTLYLVQQQKDIEALKKQNAALEERLNQKK